MKFRVSQSSDAPLMNPGLLNKGYVYLLLVRFLHAGSFKLKKAAVRKRLKELKALLKQPLNFLTLAFYESSGGIV